MMFLVVTNYVLSFSKGCLAGGRGSGVELCQFLRIILLIFTIIFIQVFSKIRI